MDDNFEKWVKQWDAACKEIAAEQPKQQSSVRTSYYTGLPSSLDFEDRQEAEPEWNNIHNRAEEVDQVLHDSVAYMGDEGYGKEVLPPVGVPLKPGKKTYTNNPIHFSSWGPDAEDPKTGLTPVTKNWNDGEELLKVDELKRKIEIMEREAHEADVRREKNRAKLYAQLKEMRHRVKELSERLAPTPQDDRA